MNGDEGKKLGKLSYVTLDKVPNNEVKKLEDLIFALTLKEKTDFQNELDKIEQEISENHFLNSSFGVGDRMYRRLAINAKDKNKNS